ncbi:cytosolic invertase 1 [Striga asiatica]|uniref:Cytosolic invertase 1 n=1 Tax=Striga asiatica TaxID=4170 RepID=A0A5A7RAE6_STRAF|nr:cytosolic invertase 1 [Striga asiatica]
MKLFIRNYEKISAPQDFSSMFDNQLQWMAIVNVDKPEEICFPCLLKEEWKEVIYWTNSRIIAEALNNLRTLAGLENSQVILGQSTSLVVDACFGATFFASLIATLKRA